MGTNMDYVSEIFDNHELVYIRHYVDQRLPARMNRTNNLERTYYALLETTKDALHALINRIKGPWGRDTWERLLSLSATGSYAEMRELVTLHRNSKTRSTMLDLINDAERYTSALAIF